MEIILSNPRGFCAGVNRAIEIVERALDIFGAPIYVRHEVVHNKFVVDGLRDKGAVFIEELSEIPDDATVIFSAHGVSKVVSDEAEQRGLKVFDATCPLVTKVHLEVTRHQRAGLNCVLIGHAGHPEVEGTMGRYESNGSKTKMYLVESPEDVQQLSLSDDAEIAYVTQTTLSVDDTKSIIAALKQKYPDIIGPRKDDICYATQNRQDAVKELAQISDVVFVVGSVNSSNSNRLKEVAERFDIPAYLIDNASEIDKQWLEGKHKVGISAGASAPEVLVEEVVKQLTEWGATSVNESSGREENVFFSLPRVLQKKASQ